MTSPTDPTDPRRLDRAITHPRRCRNCYYVLEHLDDTGVCPECGVQFDLHNPYLHTTRPPLVWWTLWLPGLVTAVGCGLLLYLFLIPQMGFTWSTVLAIPTAVGVILGYRTAVSGKVALALLGLLAVVALGIGLLSLNLAGIFCTLVIGVIMLLPILLGMAVGVLLRWKLKNSKFSQRAHLPIILLATVLAAMIEGRHTNLTAVTTSTSVVMQASPEQAWAAIQFYEQVKHRPPLLLRITPTFRPAYTTGKSGQVGDVKVCVYERGRLVKEVTEVVPGRRLAFRVIEQTDIQTRGVRLIDGSFDFEPAEGGGTKVTLTTRYQPLLEPRFAFLPAEDLAVHTLHGHVLKGMSEDAEKR